MRKQLKDLDQNKIIQLYKIKTINEIANLQFCQERFIVYILLKNKIYKDGIEKIGQLNLDIYHFFVDKNINIKEQQAKNINFKLQRNKIPQFIDGVRIIPISKIKNKTSIIEKLGYKLSRKIVCFKSNLKNYQNNKIKYQLKLKDEEFKKKEIQRIKQWKKNNNIYILQSNKAYKQKYKQIEKAQRKQYKENNKDIIKIKGKQYRDNLPIQKKKKTKQNFNRNRKIRYQTDVIFKLITVFRSRIKIEINKKNLIKNSQTRIILGDDIPVIKKYIQSQFKDGMTWSNWNYETWHLDHIISLSQAENSFQLQMLGHYKNLRPISAFQNLSKSDKFPQVDIVPEDLMPIYVYFLNKRQLKKIKTETIK